MTTLNCLTCKTLISEAENLAIYRQSPSSSHLSIKLEKRNIVLDKLLLKEVEDKKKKTFIKSTLVCEKCNSKIGLESLIGPKSEAMFCFRAEAIILGRLTFKKSPKWIELSHEYQDIEIRDPETLHGVENVFKREEKKFTETIFPKIEDICKCDIASMIADVPRKYQIELYISAMCSNTVVYLQTGAGKTLVAAMITAHMKKLNPKKKIYFVCDRIPLVFQQADYLRHQTGLTVGEFCGENKDIMESQLKCDVLVFTVGFLNNIIFNKMIDLEDCCCLFIDEIHHAKNGHPFVRLIEDYYVKAEGKYRPRIVGLTASPSSSSKSENEMKTEIIRLCTLIEGSISMPIMYQKELKEIVNRPNLNFKQISTIPNCSNVKNHIFEFMQYIFTKLKIDIDNTRPSNIILKSTIDTFVKRLNLNSQAGLNNEKYLRDYVFIGFLKKLINSLEILDILGITSSIEFINSCIETEKKNNIKANNWSNSEINKMVDFQRLLSLFNGNSEKLDIICNYIKDESKFDQNSKIIIFVRSRKTARYVCEYLCKDEQIKKRWNPSIFVGHASGQIDGMGWYEEQQPALDKFIENKCRLFVATNVLQEGLDVPECDNVILFDIMLTLTEYVQSKGRARRIKSNFIVIGTKEDEESYDTLVKLEEKLIRLIPSLMAYNSSFDHMISSQISLFHSNHLDKNKNNNHKPISNSSSDKIMKFVLQVYLEDTTHSDNNVDTLTASLRKCKGFKESETIKKPLLSNLQLFEKTRMVKCLFELSVKNGPLKFEEVKSILQTATFLVHKCNFNILINYIQLKNDSFTNPKLQAITKFELGNLVTPFRFCKSSESFDNATFIIQYEMKNILVLFFKCEKLYKLEISFDSIDNLIALSDNDDYFDVFVPTKRPPFSYLLVPKKDEIISPANLSNIEEEYLAWERIILNIDSTIHFKFDANDKARIVKSLKNCSKQYVFFTNVNSTKINYTINDLRNDFKSPSLEIDYYFECFISQCQYFIQGKICKKFVCLLNDLKIEKLGKVLEKLTLILGSFRYCDILKILESIIEDGFSSESDLSDLEKNLVFIKRVTVCPSRIIFHFPTPTVSNRITRKYGNEHFIRARFRDEDFNKLNMSQNYSDMSKLYSRIYTFLINGINIAGVKYDFLAMSSSQMRDHGCWLFVNKENMNPDIVRGWMGDFSNIRCIGKLAARLGQSLSTSTATFETDDFEIIPEIEVGNYNFTDGIGKISKEKVDELCNDYFKISNASTFQIRFAGFKGVVALDPNLTGKQLQFRKSMKKFDCPNYKRLDILNIAEYIPCYLNRQVIIILSSLGIKDESFDNLHSQFLHRMSALLVEEQKAKECLSQYFTPIVSIRVDTSKLILKLEPFFRNLLLTIHQKLLQGLIDKSRIFVPKGRILMGAIDETGTLNEDEIFIQCTHGLFDTMETYQGTINNQKSKTFIVNTKVAIAKNPCMHSGDVRTLNAVDNIHLRHLINCAVFPSVGSRPITNMCSGSDLDGDLYFVTWDPTLVPCQLETPMKYDSAKAKEQDEPITIKQVIEFFVDFIKVDQLGRIANAHVAISDISPLGVKDRDCITLAKIFSKAVDFPKTGAVIEFPSNIKKIKAYPDFMEKKGSWYASNKIIGKMYRKAKRLTSRDFELEILLNPSLVVEGHEQFLQRAKDTYRKYRQEIEKIMGYFECKNESELFVGLSINSNEKRYEAAREFKNCSETIRKLWTRMREIFTVELKSEILPCSNRHTMEQLAIKKASAWYVACYKNKKNCFFKILSFPWIVEDILNKIQIKNYDFFSKSIVENYLLCRDNFQSMSRFIQKIEFKNELSRQIEEKIFLIGSFGLFIFDKLNSIQLYIFKPTKTVAKINESLIKFYANVSMTNEGNIICYQDDEHDFTLTTCSASFRRFIYTKKLIHKHPLILPFLFSILHFASINGIFKILFADNIKLENFVEFCIKFYLKENSLNDIENLEIEEYLNYVDTDKNIQDPVDEWIPFQDRLDEYVKNENNFCENNLSQILLNFYRKNGLTDQKLVFQNKFEVNKILELSETRNCELKIHFLNMFNTLSKRANIKAVWEMINNEEDVPIFRSRLNMVKKSRAKFTNFFVENASIFILSNYQTDMDQVEFEPYKGERRSLHLGKNCWSVSIHRDLQVFTKECEHAVYLHILKQITKAKEVKQDYEFRFQIKYGNIYFTNIPSIFLEESCSVPLFKLREALQKGYKSYSVDIENSEKDLENEIQEKDAEIIEENENDENEDDDEITSKKEKRERKIKPKRKPLPNKAFSAFDSNIDKEIFDLNSIFDNSEFDSSSSDAFIVYLELKDINDQIKYYRVKYSSNFELLQIEKTRIKWMSVDIRNTTNKKSKDIRFSLESNKIIHLNESHSEFNTILNEKLKHCILRVVDGEPRVDEPFRDSNVFLKRSKRMKYFGGIESWQSIFNLVQMKLPDNFPVYVLEKIKFAIQETHEFTESDQQGHFTVSSQRKELSVSLKVDINTIKNSECKDYTIVLWFIGNAFSKLLEE